MSQDDNIVKNVSNSFLNQLNLFNDTIITDLISIMDTRKAKFQFIDQINDNINLLRSVFLFF